MDTIFVAVQEAQQGLLGSDFTLGVLSGVAVAILTGALIFGFHKVTLEAGLVASIQLRQTSLRQFMVLLEGLRPHVREGAVPGYGLRVTPEPSDFFYDVRGEIYKYYSGPNTSRLIQFYARFYRIEVLLQGLGEDLLFLRKDQKALDRETAQNLHDRIDRIESLVRKCLVARFERVADLPLVADEDAAAHTVLRSEAT